LYENEQRRHLELTGNDSFLSQKVAYQATTPNGRLARWHHRSHAANNSSCHLLLEDVGYPAQSHVNNYVFMTVKALPGASEHDT
jgi:hypothetical protein